MWENRPTTEKCGLLRSTTLTVGITGSASSIGRTWTDSSTSNSSGGGAAGHEIRMQNGGKLVPPNTGMALPYTSPESQEPSSRMPSGHWVVKVLMRLARLDNRNYYRFATRVLVPWASTYVSYVERDRPQHLRRDNRTGISRDRLEDVPRHAPSKGACGKGGAGGSHLSYRLLGHCMDTSPS